LFMNLILGAAGRPIDSAYLSKGSWAMSNTFLFD
jgi:hypothetical protein